MHPRNACDQVWSTQLKSAWSARRASTSSPLAGYPPTECPGSVYVAPLTVVEPSQLAFDCSLTVGPLQAPTALKASSSLIPVCCSQLATYATSTELMWTSGGESAGLLATPTGQVTSEGLEAAGVHWYCELHWLSARKVSSTSWPK